MIGCLKALKLIGHIFLLEVKSYHLAFTVTFVISRPTVDLFRSPKTYDTSDTMATGARKRKQRRQKAILPLKVYVGVGSSRYLGHTLDISASGARIVVTAQIPAGTPVSVDFKQRRTTGTAIWCIALREGKYDYLIGVQLPNAGSSFWGIQLPTNEADAPEDVAAMSFTQFLESTSNQP